MVYIDRNGRVCEHRPWDFGRMVEIFISIWFIIVHLFVKKGNFIFGDFVLYGSFKTLVAPFIPGNRGNNSRQNSWNSGDGGGGGGGGNGPSSRRRWYRGNNGIQPNRRIGRITNTMDCNIPGGG